MNGFKKIPTSDGVPVFGILRADGRWNIGEHCTHCGRNVSWGSGLFVNRVPSGWSEGLGTPELVGYMCADCQMETCETCGEETLDFSMKPECGVICDDCSGVTKEDEDE